MEETGHFFASVAGQIASGQGTWWAPLVYILIAGWLATDFWRFAGVLLAGKIGDRAWCLVWVSAVANALIAAVVARMVLFPVGSLAASPLWMRLLAVALGFVAWYFAGRRVVTGILVGEGVLLAAMTLLPAS